MLKLFISTFLLLLGYLGFAEPQLYPFQEKGKWGYLNEAGNVAIKPTFDNANGFTEGLGCVRANGYYGYINLDGSWAIKAKYDYAEPFTKGLAVVYVGSKPLVIDNKGKVSYAPNYQGFTPSIVSFLAQNRSIAKQIDELTGSNNTAFEGSLKPVDDYLIVTFYNKLRRAGLLGPSGNWIVAIQELDEIERYKKDYFIVTNYQRSRDTIDNLGNKISSETSKTTKFRAAFTYGPNSYVVRDENYNFLLVDSNGVLLLDKPFRKIAMGYGCNDELNSEEGIIYAYKTNEGIFAIDRAGNIVNGPLKKTVAAIQYGPVLVTSGMYTTPSEYLYGVWNGITNQLIEPQYDDIYSFWPSYQPKTVKLKGIFTFLDTLGNIVWQQKNDTSLVPLNIDYQNSGYFYASSKSFTKIENGSSIFNGVNDTAINRLKVHVENDTTIWRRNIAGHSVYVSNTTTDTAYFAAQDSRIEMLVQAQDEKGQWRDIEFLPNSSCGYSFKTLSLPNGCYWQFVVPMYEGAIKTKLRIKCTYKWHKKSKETETVFSNEWEGSINPAQLWRMVEYTPAGLMDPY